MDRELLRLELVKLLPSKVHDAKDVIEKCRELEAYITEPVIKPEPAPVEDSFAGLDSKTATKPKK